MQPKFGTSGLRGLATALTSALIKDYVGGYLSACEVGEGVFIGQDLRVSSPSIARVVADVVCGAGHTAYVCGPCATPALALAAQSAGAGAIMVTGSHIPSDRNGLKFYSTAGEITKSDELAILDRLGCVLPGRKAGGQQNQSGVMATYNARYVAPFANALNGLRIGVFAHSAVGRDELGALLAGLGADVTMLGHRGRFVPLDTESVDQRIRDKLSGWAKTHALDAIVSTDADGDRPLLTDAKGCLVPGDILGQITARALGAAHVVTPITSNSGVLLRGFDKVTLTKIGSPYVLAAMGQAGGKVVGYEANGGFILGFEARGIAPLLTRDAILPLLSVLSLARDKGVADLVGQELTRVTASDRLQDINVEDARTLLAQLIDAPETLFDAPPVHTDQTDGLRFQFAEDEILHLRLSGNAPELRVYAEADCASRAQALLRFGMQSVAGMLQA